MNATSLTFTSNMATDIIKFYEIIFRSVFEFAKKIILCYCFMDNFE